jgi:hypothetical protein
MQPVLRSSPLFLTPVERAGAFLRPLPVGRTIRARPDTANKRKDMEHDCINLLY